MTARRLHSLAALELAAWTETRRGTACHIEGGLTDDWRLMSGERVLASAPRDAA